MPYPSKAQHGGLEPGVIADQCGALVETYLHAINAVLTVSLIVQLAKQTEGMCSPDMATLLI